MYVSHSHETRHVFAMLIRRCTDSSAASYMWSQIEPSAAILGACIVTYRPLFRDVRLPSFITKLTSTRTETGDVSRRWPSGGDSEKGSEARLVRNDARAGQGMTIKIKRSLIVAHELEQPHPRTPKELRARRSLTSHTTDR